MSTVMNVRILLPAIFESEAYILGKSSIFTVELSQKSESEPSTTKSDNIGHPIVKTGQIWPLGWFWPMLSGFIVEGWKSNFCNSWNV